MQRMSLPSGARPGAGGVRQQAVAVLGGCVGLFWALGNTGLLEVAWVQSLLAFSVGIALPVLSAQILGWHQRSKSASLPLPAAAAGRRRPSPVVVRLARDEAEAEGLEDEEAGFDEEAPAELVPQVAEAAPEGAFSETLRLGALVFDLKARYEAIPNARLLDKKSKSKMWWQPEDFAEFLRVRVLIGRAYHAVAKRRGVAVDSDFPPEPVLAHESRLGLCLGRQEERTQARRRYMSAVLREQARQLASGRQGRDVERLASVAWQASKAERRFATERAARHHQKVCKDPEQDAETSRRSQRSSKRRTDPWGVQTGTPMGRAVSASCCCEKEFKSELGNNDDEIELFECGQCVRSVTEGYRPVGADGEEESAMPDSPKQDVRAGTATWPKWSSEATTAESVSEIEFSSEDGAFADDPSGCQLGGARISPLDFLAAFSTADSRGFGLSRDDLKRMGVSPAGHLLRSYLPTPVRGRSAKDASKGGDPPGARSKFFSNGKAAESEEDGEGNGAETTSTNASTPCIGQSLEQASGDDEGWDSACDGGSEEAEDCSEG